MDVLYKAKATATGGGRDGHTRSEDGKLDFQLSVPKELGGPGGGGTNPEQLFATGYAACFLGAMRFAAAQEKVTVPPDATVSAEVGIGKIEGGFNIDVELTVHVPGLDKAAVDDLVAKTHKVCPYSNATRGNVDVRTKVV
jgi:Ohr subfamily peroxiredoxin